MIKYVNSSSQIQLGNTNDDIYINRIKTTSNTENRILFFYEKLIYLKLGLEKLLSETELFYKFHDGNIYFYIFCILIWAVDHHEHYSIQLCRISIDHTLGMF